MIGTTALSLCTVLFGRLAPAAFGSAVPGPAPVTAPGPAPVFGGTTMGAAEAFGDTAAAETFGGTASRIGAAETFGGTAFGSSPAASEVTTLGGTVCGGIVQELNYIIRLRL